MKNTIRTMISIARANPAYARLAITLDASIGLAVGVVTYLIMNATDVAATGFVVLVAGSIMFVVGMTVMGYTLMFNAMVADGYTTYAFDDDDSATDYDVDMDRERESQ